MANACHLPGSGSALENGELTTAESLALCFVFGAKGHGVFTTAITSAITTDSMKVDQREQPPARGDYSGETEAWRHEGASHSQGLRVQQ